MLIGRSGREGGIEDRGERKGTQNLDGETGVILCQMKGSLQAWGMWLRECLSDRPSPK